MGMAERSARRRKIMVTHRARSFRDAEQWDLEFWQSQTPEQRLSALVAIREDVAKVIQSRRDAEQADGEDS